MKSGAGCYHFGFNGKEKDTEGEWGTQTHYDYGFRIYAPGIGRFLSVDPLMTDYAYYSPYQYAGNKPIYSIDIDGLEDVGYMWANDGKVGVPELAVPLDFHASPVEAQLIFFKSYSRLPGVGNKPYQYRYVNYSLDVNLKSARGTAGLFELGFTNYLPKRFLTHYSLGNGNDYRMNKAEMKDVRAIPVGIQGRKSIEQNRFSKILSKLKIRGSIAIDYSVVSGALNSGTLGNFKVQFKGVLKRTKDGFTFEGKMRFYDEWNFDKGTSTSRPATANYLVKIADKYLDGKEFKIFSEWVPVKQNQYMESVDWFGAMPKAIYNIPSREVGDTKKDTRNETN